MAKGFECLRCGNCCRIIGYVRLRDDDIDAISSYLGLSVHDFTKRYSRLMENRQHLALIERADSSCIFLMKDHSCLVNTVKPKQCRDFPNKWRYDGFEKICKGGVAKDQTGQAEIQFSGTERTKIDGDY